MPRRSTASSTIRLDTNVVNCALRVSLEFVGVGVAEQGADVAAGDVAGLVDQLPALVIAPGQPHAGALRPLAREGESEHCRQARPPDADGRATGG